MVNRSTSTAQRRAASPDLFGEFPLDGLQVVLPSDIEQSGGRLDKPVSYGVPILPDEGHPVMIIERDHPDSARVLEVFPSDQLPVGRPYLDLARNW